MAVDFLPPLFLGHKKTRTQRAFSGNLSEPQWPLTTDSRVRRCRVDGSLSNNKALYRFHCHKRATTVDVLALVVALFRIFG